MTIDGPAPVLERGFDYSPFLFGPLTRDDTDALAQQGMRRACIAIDSSPETIQTCLNCVASGMALDAYRELALSNSASIAPSVSDSLLGFSLLSRQHVSIRRLWLTAEDTGADAVQLASNLLMAVNLLRGFDIGIYSGDWYWGVYLTDTALFDSLPKWWAVYDGIQTIGVGLSGKQYQGDVTLLGMAGAFDLDAWWV